MGGRKPKGENSFFKRTPQLGRGAGKKTERTLGLPLVVAKKIRRRKPTTKKRGGEVEEEKEV